MLPEVRGEARGEEGMMPLKLALLPIRWTRHRGGLGEPIAYTVALREQSNQHLRLRARYQIRMAWHLDRVCCARSEEGLIATPSVYGTRPRGMPA